LGFSVGTTGAVIFAVGCGGNSPQDDACPAVEEFDAAVRDKDVR
jgi:hypothetical protein